MPSLKDALVAAATGTRDEAYAATGYLSGLSGTSGNEAQRKFGLEHFSNSYLRLSQFGGPTTPVWAGDAPVYQDAAFKAAYAESEGTGKPLLIEGQVWLDPDGEGPNLIKDFTKLHGLSRWHSQIRCKPGSALTPVRTPQTAKGDAEFGATGYVLRDFLIDFGWSTDWANATDSALQHADFGGLELVNPTNANPNNHDTDASIGLDKQFQDAHGHVENLILFGSPNSLLRTAGRSEVKMIGIWGMLAAGVGVDWGAFDTWCDFFSIFNTGDTCMKLGPGTGQGSFDAGKLWFGGCAQDGALNADWGGHGLEVTQSSTDGLQISDLRIQDVSRTGARINGSQHDIEIQVDSAGGLFRDYGIGSDPGAEDMYGVDILGDRILGDIVVRDRKWDTNGQAIKSALRYLASANNNDFRLSADPAMCINSAVIDSGTANLTSHAG